VRAILITEFGIAPTVAEVPRPGCPPRGAVIRVEATGVCRSDWHGWMGHDDDIVLPHVPGHEFAGTIDEIGAEVTGWHVGQRVTVPFVFACGACEQCLSGNQQVCDRQVQPGFMQWGSFAEFVSIAEAEVNLVELPDSLDFASAAGLGCRFATAYRAVVAQGSVREGQWVAVHGCGGVGLSAIMIALAAGARVVGVDPSPTARAAAAELGAEVIGAVEDIPAEVHRLTQGGAHLSIDAFGSIATCANSIRSLRKRGRHVQVGLMLADQAVAAIPMHRVISHELEIVGSHGMAAHEYPAMLDAIASGRLDPRVLVGRTIGLDEGGDALATMDGQRSAGMTIITMR
jgi:alcohol dehydrogenase